MDIPMPWMPGRLPRGSSAGSGGGCRRGGAPGTEAARRHAGNRRERPSSTEDAGARGGSVARAGAAVSVGRWIRGLGKRDQKANRVPVDPSTAMVTDGLDELRDDDDDRSRPLQRELVHMLGAMGIDLGREAEDGDTYV
jgi:hypothetical protein